MDRSLKFVKIHLQAEDFFNFLSISLDKYDARELSKITDIVHRQITRVAVFLGTSVEKKFQNKSMLVNIEFIQILKGPFIDEIVIAEEIYQYSYPYYSSKFILFLPTYNDYYQNFIIKIKLLFIESYSSSEVEKRIHIKTFLSQFRRSNQKITKIKKEIPIILNNLQKKGLIDSRFKLVL